jgi:hypothetical protein
MIPASHPLSAKWREKAGQLEYGSVWDDNLSDEDCDAWLDQAWIFRKCADELDAFLVGEHEKSKRTRKNHARGRTRTWFHRRTLPRSNQTGNS